MQFSKLIERIKDNLGRDDLESENMIKDSINWIITEDLPKQGLKPFLKHDTSLTTTTSQEYVDLPSDFTKCEWVGIDYDGDSIYDELSNLRSYRDLYDYNDEGNPDKKLIFQNKLYLRPIPNGSYSLDLWYYAVDSELVNDTDTSLVSDYYSDEPVISGATYRMACKLNLQDLIGLWGRLYSIEISKLINWQYSQVGKGNRMRWNDPYR